MPFTQKIKSVLHRGDKAPEAPVAPAPLVAAPVAAPLNGDVLLHQREALHETSVLNNGLANNGLINNDLTNNALAREESFREERALSSEYSTAGSYSVLEGSNYAGNRLSVGATRTAPTVLETIEKEVVVHERIHPMEKEELQQIIYREREQLDVKQITQMMHETEIQPTLVEQRELPAQVRDAVVERAAPIPENLILPTREVNATARTQVVHAPIVEEVIKRTVIEEIQPVLERDVYAPTVVLQNQPIYEKIVEAPTVYRETREVRELGTRTVGLENDSYGSYNGLASNGIATDLETRAEMLETRNMSSSAYNSSGSFAEDRLLNNQAGLLNNQTGIRSLPTGQVLPEIASSRPAYAYLPSTYTEQRPVFIGTASDYVRAANGLPTSTLAHSKALPTANSYAQQQVAPAAYLRQ